MVGSIARKWRCSTASYSPPIVDWYLTYGYFNPSLALLQSALGVGDDWLRRVFTAVPLMQRVFRWLLYVRQELLFVVGFTPARWTGRAFVDAMRVILSGQVAAGVRAAATAATSGGGAVQSEEAIQAKTRGLLKTLTPSYLPGCKRLLIRCARWSPHKYGVSATCIVLIHLHVSSFPLHVFILHF